MPGGGYWGHLWKPPLLAGCRQGILRGLLSNLSRSRELLEPVTSLTSLEGHLQRRTQHP